MTNAMRKRLKSGLQWKTDKAPLPSFTDWLLAALAVLIFLLITSLLGTGSANTEADAAKAAQIKAEVALLALLNGTPLVDRESGMVLLAKVETAGGE